MKTVGVLFVFGFGLAVTARADLTMVQTVEGAGPTTTTMTVKVKDNMVRIDSSPTVSTIFDARTGEITNLMLDQKKIFRMSAKKLKAAAALLNQYTAADKKSGGAKPALVATGKKEKVNGYDTEEYVFDAPTYKASYWVAPQYPNGAAIMKQLELLNSGLFDSQGMYLPDYRSLTGLPIKTVMAIAGNQITSTLVSVKQDPIAATEFVPPKDFEEMKVPDLGDLLQQHPTKP
ncbi:MAG TPA: DUF4412 domain-containing protein [Chthoniobacterales bacterium]|nr:DUF4412 domain-containing protein [Chthoniobacterales bacterium]